METEVVRLLPNFFSLSTAIRCNVVSLRYLNEIFVKNILAGASKDCAG